MSHRRPRYFEDLTVGFTDFVDYGKWAQKMAVEDLVNALDAYFTAFDQIAERYGVEKVKTIGDSYMFVGGLPARRVAKPIDAVLATLEMVETAGNMGNSGAYPNWGLRVGVNTGPVIGGVVGKCKPMFDIWGETVNLASRMESSGEPNRVNISEFTFARVKDFVSAKHRGSVKTKEDDQVKTYLVEGVLPELMSDGPDSPPRAFQRRYERYFKEKPPSFPRYLLSPNSLKPAGVETA
jgi:class 3 adenylate cyclase